MNLVKLKNIAKVISGYAFKSSDFIRNNGMDSSGIPAIKIKNIKNGDIDLSECDFVENNFLSINERYHLKRNDILVSLTGSHLTQPNSVVGRIALYRHSFVSLLNQRAGKIIPNNKLVEPLFLYAFLSQDSVKESIAKKARGAANQANISPGDVEDTYIYLPPLPTQRRIASILSAYDDLIENNLKRIKLLEELAQRTYEEWFVKFRINGEPLPIDEKTGLPEGWVKRPLNEIAEIISGFAFKSGDYVKDGKYKIVTIKNVQDGYFIPDTTDSLTEVPRKVKQSQILKSGDIILSLTGNVGRTCLVFGQNYLLNQRVAKLIAKRPEHYSFIYFLLRSKAMVVALENLSNGAAQQNLSPINMGNYLVALPDDEVLNRYSNQFNNHIDLICQLNNEISLLKESRDILLPRLMSGKINVE